MTLGAIVAGCASGAQVPTQPTGPGAGAVVAVSRSHPNADAVAALQACGLGPGAPIVVAMGSVAVADITSYVPLTGTEPALRDPGSAWIIETTGDAVQPNGDVWTDETCIVTRSDAGWYATGPIRTASGVVVTQLPAAALTALPSMAP
jgi:hypothetical protein